VWLSEGPQSSPMGQFSFRSVARCCGYFEPYRSCSVSLDQADLTRFSGFSPSPCKSPFALSPIYKTTATLIAKKSDSFKRMCSQTTSLVLSLVLHSHFHLYPHSLFPSFFFLLLSLLLLKRWFYSEELSGCTGNPSHRSPSSSGRITRPIFDQYSEGERGRPFESWRTVTTSTRYSRSFQIDMDSLERSKGCLPPLAAIQSFL
jgi:hypothetical protein